MSTKSYPVDFPHLQILRYMLEIWDRQVREQQPLSLIIPILVYHGKEGGNTGLSEVILPVS
ncbi:MAG: Rpn family recombination-promoting nuclease/putative transposase [Bacteroidia bacterium]